MSLELWRIVGLQRLLDETEIRQYQNVKLIISIGWHRLKN